MNGTRGVVVFTNRPPRTLSEAINRSIMEGAAVTLHLPEGPRTYDYLLTVCRNADLSLWGLSIHGPILTGVNDDPFPHRFYRGTDPGLDIPFYVRIPDETPTTLF